MSNIQSIFGLIQEEYFQDARPKFFFLLYFTYKYKFIKIIEKQIFDI